MTAWQTFYEILLYMGVVTGVFCTGIFASLLLKRSKLAFLVKLETLFVTVYVAMTLYFVTLLIQLYKYDILHLDNEIPQWLIILEATMFFVAQIC